ncbi:uncharacterized protein BDZ99DRAFT_483037 [Mytilinidion resinicola]|uniref:Zn(2)-C6 fungal-type domain-containing protein n=1 Tax=Mytilinidion resinicola TaxID=574789 RepID=A0A6A6Y1A8_9PEZI|nr:uncharacterized protein BDZ99DRAFT_483037 [Mytilinidion resinicola]KAF2802303.1 hypothetical protein BDZ99DRAFT_483037 [Mytilinidion resinicola]
MHLKGEEFRCVYNFVMEWYLECVSNCDETPGKCKQCTRLGLHCSGAIQGSMIIDMTERVKNKKPRKRKQRVLQPPVETHQTDIGAQVSIKADEISRREAPRGLAIRPSPIEASPGVISPTPEATGCVLDVNPTIIGCRQHFRLAFPYQPSLVEIYDQAFIYQFVELHKGWKAPKKYDGDMPWVTRLPELSSSSAKPVIKYSIRAASMAFYGQAHQDVSVMTDSYRWYSTGLALQRGCISDLEESHIPGIEEVIVPMVMSLYEVVASTTQTSVFHHLDAASNVLNMRGPTNCTTGLPHQLLKVMRVTSANVSLMTNSPSLFSSRPWLTLPFSANPKQPLQLLTDIILSIPHCLSLSGRRCSLVQFFDAPPSNQTIRASIFSRATDLQTALLAWHQTHSEPTFRDTLTALTACTYHAASLVVQLILSATSPFPSASPSSSLTASHSHSRSVASHATSILQISRFLEYLRPVGFDLMRSIFALAVVALLSPSEGQKGEATKMLERWGQDRGLSGICSAWKIV